jgi:hypothetical protein
MQLLKELQEQIDKIWEPVLCPIRTPICDDLLGPQYISVSLDSVYKRHDEIIESFDKKELVFTTFTKINERMKSLINLRKSSVYGIRDSGSPKKFINEFRMQTSKSNFKFSKPKYLYFCYILIFYLNLF